MAISEEAEGHTVVDQVLERIQHRNLVVPNRMVANHSQIPRHNYAWDGQGVGSQHNEESKVEVLNGDRDQVNHNLLLNQNRNLALEEMGCQNRPNIDQYHREIGRFWRFMCGLGGDNYKYDDADNDEDHKIILDDSMNNGKSDIYNPVFYFQKWLVVRIGLRHIFLRI
jgi:hypothetical protein